MFAVHAEDILSASTALDGHIIQTPPYIPLPCPNSLAVICISSMSSCNIPLLSRPEGHIWRLWRLIANHANAA